MSDDRRVIALVGMPGVGKSTVGPLVAERLGVPFHDLDDLIVATDGRDIPTIFAADGEAGFRRLERAALASVLETDEPLVIATGGGIVTDEGSRQLLSRARCVYLRASVATLVARVASSG